MDYFSVIVLVIIVFVFVSDRNIKSIDVIQQEKTSVNIEQEIYNIKQELEIIKFNTKDIESIKHKDTLNIIKKSNKKYILIKNVEIKLNNEQINTIIANYISSNKNPCGFNFIYTYKTGKWSFKKMYLDIINYLNIFNKKDLDTYGIIICNKSDLALDKTELKNRIISYTPNEISDIEYNKEDINTLKLKNICLKKISNANIEIVIKIALLIISGSIITTNLIQSLLNINNINDLIISFVIYYCYSYIIRYIYRPIGKKRIIATYIFPLYFIVYIVVGTYTIFYRVIKNVHAS